MKAKTKKTSKGLSYKTLSVTAWAFPALVVAVVVLATVLVLLPQFQQLMDDRKSLEQESDELEQLVEKRTTLSSLSEATIKNQMDTTVRVLPNDKPVFAFLSSFSGLVDDIEDLELLEYDFSPGEIASESADETNKAKKNVQGQLASIPIEVGLEGSLETILELMERIEKMAPLADVDGFSLSGDLNEEDAESGGRSFTMQLNLYYSNPPKSILKPNEPLAVMLDSDIGLIEKLEDFKVYDGLDEFEVEALLEQEREDIFNF